MNVGEMQRKLSLWAEQDKDFQFFDLYHLLYDREWLRLAHDYVAQNAGSITAGCDGINMKLFDEDLENNLQQLAKELKSETFEPFPVRRVYIPKANGKVRPLGIPSIRDRIIQEALRMVLEPIFEADFSQYSFGFRPNRCTMDAIKAITWSTTERKKNFWVIEGDITSYFDTINHVRLMRCLKRRIKDKKILRLTWKFLRAGVMEKKLFQDTKQGTPQGGIISPLLANIYLDSLDKYMERYSGLSEYEKTKRCKQGVGNHVYIRYADDFVILSNGTKAEVEALREELYTFLRNQLRLELSKEKTKITHLNEGFQFLGFWIQRKMGNKGMVTKTLIPPSAVAKLRSKIVEATSPSAQADSVNTKIRALNRLYGGWCRYYQYTGKAQAQFNQLGHELFRAMAHWLGRKFKLNMPAVMRQFYRDGTFATRGCQLLTSKSFPTRIYATRFLKPNPYTTQEIRLQREEVPLESTWTGRERRVSLADLRTIILERDGYICQWCGKPVTARTAEIDHIRPVRRFKRPVDANTEANLQTLHVTCHREKTEYDRQVESRMR